MTNLVPRLLPFIKNKRDSGNLKKRILNSTIQLAQTLNVFAFPFPVRWKRKHQHLSVSNRILKLYWLSVLYKLFHTAVLIIAGLLNFFSKQHKSANISEPVLVTNVAVLFCSMLADLAFIFTAHEIAPSFNWSYQMLERHLGDTQIGRKTKSIIIYRYFCL